jgi:hypothetical protein
MNWLMALGQLAGEVSLLGGMRTYREEGKSTLRRRGGKVIQEIGDASSDE